LPQGMFPRDLSESTSTVNSDVLQSQWDVSVKTCRRRLENLRHLVGEGAFEEAIDASFALVN
jgi:hypothetical protein